MIIRVEIKCAYVGMWPPSQRLQFSGVQGWQKFSKHDQALAEWRPLKVERSSLGGPTISDPERYSPQCPGCVSEPCKAQRTYKFTRCSVVLTCWLVSCAPSSKLEQQPTALTMEPIAAEGIQHHEESVVFGCPVEGCIKVYQSHHNLQQHLDAGRHLLALERESTYNVIKKRWTETCKSISGS